MAHTVYSFEPWSMLRLKGDCTILPFKRKNKGEMETGKSSLECMQRNIQQKYEIIDRKLRSMWIWPNIVHIEKDLRKLMAAF